MMSSRVLIGSLPGLIWNPPSMGARVQAKRLLQPVDVLQEREPVQRWIAFDVKLGPFHVPAYEAHDIIERGGSLLPFVAGEKLANSVFGQRERDSLDCLAIGFVLLGGLELVQVLLDFLSLTSWTCLVRSAWVSDASSL